MRLTASDLETLMRAVDFHRRALMDELAHTEAPPLKPALREEIDRLEWIRMKLEEMSPEILAPSIQR